MSKSYLMEARFSISSEGEFSAFFCKANLGSKCTVAKLKLRIKKLLIKTIHNDQSRPKENFTKTLHIFCKINI